MLPPAISRVEYEVAKRELTVRFTAGVYVYAGVPEEVGAAAQRLSGDELVYAFDTQIEGKYQSRRIGT